MFYFREKKSFASEKKSESLSPKPSEVFVVEKILDKRKHNGKTEYLLKWVDYEDEDNTWEPEENLGCPELIKTFELNLSTNEEERKKIKSKYAKRKSSNSSLKRGESSSSSKSSECIDRKNSSTLTRDENVEGEEFELEDEHLISIVGSKVPNKIIGASLKNGQLVFFTQWKDDEDVDLIPAKIMNEAHPQSVIKFYEERLAWSK